MSSKKNPVSIHVFPMLDAVELVQYDERAGEIEKISALPCQFDPASRQMADPEQMTQTIRDLYNMNRISFSVPTVLILPSFFTREIELPAEFSREELRFALISEAERFYVFKKTEPQIDWVNLDADHLLYAAFPRPEIERYMKVFQELRIPLQAIDLGYFSMLRGLMATGAVRKEVDEGDRWCLVSVSDHSFFASIQEGLSLKKTSESPLSVTVDDTQSIVQEIQQDFDSFTDQEVFSKLVVVNNASRIPSELLLGQLGQASSVILVEQNASTLKSRGAANAQYPCSLEGLGGIFYHHFPEIPAFNFLPELREDLASILHFRQEAIKWLLISNGALALCCLLLWGVLTLLLWQKDQEREDVIRQIAGMGASVSPARRDEIIRKKYIQKVVARNVRINNFLIRLGGLVHKDVWLDKVLVISDRVDEPLHIRVDGKTFDLERVNALLSPLNAELQDGNGLEVSTAAQNTAPDGATYFTWSIQNGEHSDATAASPAQPPSPPPSSPVIAPPGASPPAQGG